MRKKKLKGTSTSKVAGAALAAAYIPLGIALKLAKPKKHRHGGRWCRKY